MEENNTQMYFIVSGSTRLTHESEFERIEKLTGLKFTKRNEIVDHHDRGTHPQESFLNQMYEAGWELINFNAFKFFTDRNEVNFSIIFKRRT